MVERFSSAWASSVLCPVLGKHQPHTNKLLLLRVERVAQLENMLNEINAFLRPVPKRIG